MAELRPHLLQRHLGRTRAAGRHGLVFELPRALRLWWDASRVGAGLYLLDREAERTLRGQGDEESPATRRAVLLVRKHLEGARVDALERVAGSRVLVLHTGRGALALRLGSPAPALTLALDGAAAATMGEGPPAWPLPAPDATRELLQMDPGLLDVEVEALVARGWSRPRALLAVCPTLGPALARALGAGTLSLAELRRQAVSPRPTLVTPRPLEDCDDADLVGREAVQLWPFPPPAVAGAVAHPSTWTAAVAAAQQAHLRGVGFAERQRAAMDKTQARAARLERLGAHLAQDHRGLPAPDELRHRAEALLSVRSAPGLPSGEVRVPDPYDAEREMLIAVDPRLSLPLNADRLFEKARRAERAARRVGERLEQTRADREEALREEEAVRVARNASELPALPVAAKEDRADRAGPRVYLTTRGLSLLVGRGARENQQLTFSIARPDDWWLHARDVPGAHVVLRDPEGRAGDGDRREAAEVAAFFSGARTEAQADVHVTRRRNVRPGGAPGRVRVVQSETLRVRPLDPEGRLRRR